MYAMEVASNVNSNITQMGVDLCIYSVETPMVEIYPAIRIAGVPHT